MSITATIPSPAELSGYKEYDEYLATRYQQGGRYVYSLDLSFDQVTRTVNQPDPARPTEGNRSITVSHAEDFAKYVRTRVDCIVPTLLLRAPEGVLKFASSQSHEGTDWGVLRVPRLAREDLKILDGQHRILGMHLASQKIGKDLEEARGLRAAAVRDTNPELVNHWAAKIQQLEDQRRRLATERVSLQIVVVDDAKEYKQMFFDIAENAKGITNAVKTRFDGTKIVNRCVTGVSQHPLFAERVDKDLDRILGDNANLVGLKHVADIIRTLQVGTNGRITARLESELKEDSLFSNTASFLDGLCEAFPDLDAVRQGQLSPQELRKRSLLGSVTMLRVLAGVYREVVKEPLPPAKARGTPEDHRQRVLELFRLLSGHMTTPLKKESPWVSSKALQTGSRAPTARMGDMLSLQNLMLGWYKTRPAWLYGGQDETRRAPSV